MIGTNGERESGKSVLAVQHDDDDDDDDDDVHERYQDNCIYMDDIKISK